ncbi:sensor histidine kinase [Conexibacter woesei]|uniref:sensor histidine kinase n=1 Tax=Conexibacter woesei TaxID=191495 RepID=UPI0003FF1A13|nr:histidine kinase [Conexibacter woesei]
MDVAAPHATHLAGRPVAGTLRTAAAVSCALVLVAVAATLGAGAATEDQAIAALLRATMVAAPLAAGLYARRLAPFERFSRLLLAVGVVSFLTTLSESDDAALYSLGRAAGWTLELLLVVLVLAFPDGPLRGRPDRVLAAAMGAVVAVFYFPTLILTQQFQVPSPYTSCTHDCPDNVFFPFGTDHPGVGRAFLGAGALLVFIIMLFVLVRLRARIGHASAIQRQALLPVLALGVVRQALVGVLIVARQADSTMGFVPTGATLIAWATPAIAIAFLVGLVRMRLAAERSLRSLTAAVRGTPDLRALRRAVAGSFDDPTLVLTVVGPDGPSCWLDVHGAPTPTPVQGEGRCLTLVRDGHGVLAGALDADVALADRPELLEAAAGLVAIALTNARLEAEALAAATEVRESRARIAASADEERRRIERDLHDGAQQRLVAMRIELSIVEDMVQDDPAGAAARIRELEASAEEALEELRSLAHGVRPPLLADRGLHEALRSAIARSGLPATLAEQSVLRYPPEVESAVYFCVLEALQNVAKHARGASHVRLRIDGDTRGELWFDVRDDGDGADDAALVGGVGITNMHDRLAAVGGHLHVVSRRGIGTCVFGRVPATAVSQPQAAQRAR